MLRPGTRGHSHVQAAASETLGGPKAGGPLVSEGLRWEGVSQLPPGLGAPGPTPPARGSPRGCLAGLGPSPCLPLGGGISSYAADPSRAGQSLVECLDQALQDVPKESHVGTPLYLGATAGMRLLK